jgi:hypothetical protein
MEFLVTPAWLAAMIYILHAGLLRGQPRESSLQQVKEAMQERPPVLGTRILRRGRSDKLHDGRMWLVKLPIDRACGWCVPLPSFLGAGVFSRWNNKKKDIMDCKNHPHDN